MLTHDYVEFFQTRISRVRVMVRNSCDLRYESWSHKQESVAYLSVKPHYPTVISFESIPACDRQTDGHAAYAYA